MSDQEKAQIIFEPGFSTSINKNEISGRGVGMDMVKQSLSSIGGEVLVSSEIDHGTCFTLKFSKGQNVIYF